MSQAEPNAGIRVSALGTPVPHGHAPSGERSSLASAVDLSRPGVLISLVEECCRRRIAPGRTGWSQRHHLQKDLKRWYDVAAPAAAVDRALKELLKRGRIQRFIAEDGSTWYRIVS